MMFLYHFAFDLRYFGAMTADFEHALFWLAFRALILSSFLTLVGVSIVLAERNGMSLRAFVRRVGFIAAGALAATLASWFLFPSSFIYFGVLHCIATASLVAWPLRGRAFVALALGLAVLAAGLMWSSPAFDRLAWSWIGFMTHKPVTEDYVPLAPWAAFVLMGIAAGHALGRTDFRALQPLNRSPAWLQWLGRHSLMIYLVHQPIFMGVLWLVLAH